MAQLYNKQLHFPLSGSFTGSFSGSFFGDGAGITNVSASSIVGYKDAIAIGEVTASVSLGNTLFLIKSGSYDALTVSNQGSTTLNVTGSIPHFFLINSGSRTIFKVNDQGVTQTKVFAANETPTAQYGGMYFTSQSFFVGLDQATFS
jgi:hypothetical protein